MSYIWQYAHTQTHTHARTKYFVQNSVYLWRLCIHTCIFMAAIHICLAITVHALPPVLCVCARVYLFFCFFCLLACFFVFLYSIHRDRVSECCQFSAHALCDACMYMCVCMHIRICAHVCIYACIHTHTHAWTARFLHVCTSSKSYPQILTQA